MKICICCSWGQRPEAGVVFFPRLCSLAVYVFNALADCKMTLPKTCCPTLLLTSCYLDREGGVGGMITFLSTVRWRYRRHVAQLCCWRLATLTGRGGGGGDDNVPFDCKMTLPKTRCPTLLLTSCYLDREGGWGGDDNVPFDCKMTLPKTRCPTLLLTSCHLDREGVGGGGW